MTGQMIIRFVLGFLIYSNFDHADYCKTTQWLFLLVMTGRERSSNEDQHLLPPQRI